MMEQKALTKVECVQLTMSDFTLAKQEHLYSDKVYGNNSFLKDAMMRFKKNKGAVFGLVMIVIIILLAVTGPALSGRYYRQQNLSQRNMPPRISALRFVPVFSGVRDNVDVYQEKGIPGESHFFGTDTLGRDLFSRTFMGTRISLYVAFLAILLDTLLGMSYGLISGYFGGKVDNIMQRVVEILSTIPTTVIVTLLIVVLKPGLMSITIALMITEWIGMSRVARAQMLKLKEQDFVLASRTLGASHFWIIFKDVLPNVFGQIIVMCMFTIPNAIFTEAFLAFIGLGIPAPLASLGSLISDGFKNMTMYPHMVVFPVIVLALLMLSFNLLADGLRDAFDPKMKEA